MENIDAAIARLVASKIDHSWVVSNVSSTTIWANLCKKGFTLPVQLIHIDTSAATIVVEDMIIKPFNMSDPEFDPQEFSDQLSNEVLQNLKDNDMHTAPYIPFPE